MRTIFGFLLAAVSLCSICTAADTFMPRDPRYRLHPGDVITIEYLDTPEYDATVSIQPDGFASLPLVGNLHLGGLTIPDAENELHLKANEHLNDPRITVGLKDFEKPYYIVGGEVTSPGRFDIRGRVTALRAIEMAGGFKASAKSSQVLLIRPINDVDGETKVIDLKKVTDERQLNEDVELRAGDMLIVPKTRLAKIEPYIRLVNLGFYLNPLGL